MQPVLNLPFFKEQEICPARTLKQYLEITKDIRKDQNLLFISFKKPNKAVGSQTLSRWIKHILEMSGINTEEFSAYSTRHASVSAAKRLGVSIDAIRLTAGWTKDSETFARFYNLDVIDDKTTFANAILSLKS